MITDKDMIEAEIICCVKQVYDDCPCPTSPSVEEILDYLEKCFAAKKELADVLSDTTYYIRKEKVETLEKQIEDMKTVIHTAWELLQGVKDHVVCTVGPVFIAVF